MRTERDAERTCVEIENAAALIRDLVRERDAALDRCRELEERIAAAETERDELADENAGLRAVRRCA